MTNAEFITFITPILTAIGVFIAAFGVWQNTQNAKKRATIDMIMAERNDKLLQEAIASVNQMAKEDVIFAIYASDDESNFEKRKHIIKLLNQREFVSAGVLGGALHETMYKNFSYSMFLRDWNNLKSFVYELRQKRKNPTIFQEFELLAIKWQNKPLKTKV
ncbi:Uncharacterised protein [Moraxella caprae]|uniref:DUF4760 domain-containing protein n=1 Tax=Moraxella caprae TaxID=90240 RepID=A0A378R072_9GAMM|nr:DUF4760 domain-containing protein [Moraxella caprae]STZ08652.1 Uncharacterised protein [Moraxella caprae]